MALMTLEKKWKAALTSILEELEEQQFNKLLYKLDKIPRSLRSGKAREDMPDIIVQYFGTEESISVIDKEMKQLPRNDNAVQQHLRPFVDKLKKRQQEAKGKKSKAAADSGPGAKKPKPAAGMKSQVAADSGPGAKEPKPVVDQVKSCQPDKTIPVGAVKPQQTVKPDPSLKPAGPSKTKTIPVGAVKTQQTVKPDPSLEPAGPSKTKTIPVGAVKTQQTVKPDPSLEPAGPSKTKDQSAEIYTGRITMIRIKTYNKTNIHLVVDFNHKLKTVFVTTRLLADAFGFKVEDNFIERFSYEIPLTATATVQGNKITKITKL